MRALILIADGVEDSEFLYPFYRLQEQDIPADVAAPETGTVIGKHGYECPANMPFDKINPANYDLLILPGGKAPETVRTVPKAVAVTRQMMDECKIVAAICHGPQILISAGVIKNRTMTCWKGIRDDIVAAQAHYVDRPVVVDENLVTSRCPTDLPDFTREIFNLLSN